MEKTHTNVLPFLFFLSLYRSDLQLLVILFYNRATPLHSTPLHSTHAHTNTKGLMMGPVGGLVGGIVSQFCA